MALVRRRRRGTPAEHANAETSDMGATHAAALNPHFDVIANGATALTANITTTKRCCIVVVSVVSLMVAGVSSQIQRGGVDRTVETTISPMDFVSAGQRAYIQYSTEVLDPGTYTYNLVNTSGGNLEFYGCIMKIVAVS